MLESAVDVALDAIEQYGLIVLFVVFVFEGAIVGKIVPTRTLFVAVVLLVGGSFIDYLSVYMAAVAGATVGQVSLFTLLRHFELSFQTISWVPVEQRQVDRAAFWFDQWGLPAVAVSNVVPLMRGAMTVPVAMSNASVVWFTLASGVGTVLYVGALVAVATGVDAVILSGVP